jgi:cyclase
MSKYFLLALVFVSMAANVGFSQQPSAITTEKIADNVYIVKGGMANTGFIVGEKEVAAIDAEMTADQAKKMVEEIKKTTPKPLTKLILTHSDGDHVNGVVGFPQGLEIIASSGAKKEMAEASEAPNSPSLKAYLPTRTFDEKMAIELAPERVQLLHFGPAHTSGDIVVVLPARKLAFVGDLVFIGSDPLIHRQKGGTSIGLVKTLKALLALDVDRFVPGHGNVVSKSDIETELKTVQEKQDKVGALVREGKSLDEVKQALGIASEPAKPGGFRFPSIVEIIYQELTEKSGK